MSFNSFILTIVYLSTFSVTGSLAQFVAGVSQNCQNAATTLLSSPFASCTNLVGLISVATANGSIVTPVNTWITGICTATPCNSTVLQSASSTVQSGCASDIQSNNALALGLVEITTQYAGVHDVLCLEYTSNSTYCLTDILTNYQTASGKPVTLDTLTAVLGVGFSTFLAGVPTTLCDDCLHGFVSKLEPIVANSSASAGSALTSAASQKCGSSFADGTVPASLRVTTSAATSTSSPNASVIPGLGITILALIGAFAILA